VNQNQQFLASDYTHFQFTARVGAGRGQWSFGVGFNNETGASLNQNYFGVDDVNSPEYCSTCPVDDQQWHTITIPLADLGLGNTGLLYNSIWQFYMWPTDWELINTSLYLNNVQFINAQTSYTTPAAPNPDYISSTYNYATDPYTKNDLQNLQIPGAPTLMYGSCPETLPGCVWENNGLYLGIAPVPTPSTSSIVTGSSSGSNLVGGSSSGISSAAAAVIAVLAIIAAVGIALAIFFFVRSKKGSEGF